MELVILSCIPGTDIQECAKNLIAHQQSLEKQGSALNVPTLDDCFCVEDLWVPNATDALSQAEAATKSMAEVLSLPYSELCRVCEAAFDATLDRIQPGSTCTEEKTEQKKTQEEDTEETKAGLAFLTLHPVLYHQLTTEFVEPYHSDTIRSSVAKHKMSVRAIVSIHDDIYDVYRRLLRERKLFWPENTRDRKVREHGEGSVLLRNAQQDIDELRLILDWRDRELTAARALSYGLQCKHFLFHRKGRTKTLWDAVCAEKPCVYFSHPISQPRRDITGKPDGDKCKEAKADRGYALLDSCQDLANELGSHVPLVEPTAIDEYRVDLDRLDGIRESDLSSSVLPPLWERWPIGWDKRLGAQHVPQEENGLTRVAAETFKGLEVDEMTDGGFLGRLKSAAQILAREMKRQIAVRDNALAEQADLIVAFRPYSLPDSPVETGGVRNEIKVVRRKINFQKRRCKPSIVIIHPWEDERRRRANLLERLWPDIERNYLARVDHSAREAFRKRCHNVLVESDRDTAVPQIEKEIRDAIAECGVQVEPIPDSASMTSNGIVRREQAETELVSQLIYKSFVLEPPLQIEAGKYAEEEILVVSDIADVEALGESIASIVAKGVKE